VPFLIDVQFAVADHIQQYSRHIFVFSIAFGILAGKVFTAQKILAMSAIDHFFGIEEYEINPVSIGE
jgi:hypothetical protein